MLTWKEARRTRHEEPGTKNQARRTRHEEPGTKNQAAGLKEGWLHDDYTSVSAKTNGFAARAWVVVAIACLTTFHVGCGATDDEQLTVGDSSELLTASEEDEYLPAPGGILVHRECAREVPNGATIEERADGTDIRLAGRTIERIPKCAYAPKRWSERQEAQQDGQPPALNGWIETSLRTATPNAWDYSWFNKIQTKWTVPNAPSSTGALIYFFNDLTQSPSATAILQPVLQYGCCSPAGGGDFWQIRSWYVTSSGTALFSPSVSVSSGNTITGVVSGASCNASGQCNWTVEAKRSPWSTGLYVHSSTATQTYNRADRAVLEAYAVGSCNQLPNSPSTAFTDTHLYMPGPNPNDLNEMGNTTGWSALLYGGSPDCGFSVTQSGRNATLFY